MTKSQRQPTGIGAQTQPWRQDTAQALQNGIQALETELNFQRRILTEFTGGNRAGTAGGIRAARATRATGGSTGGGGTGGTNREWVTDLLRTHGNGLTPPEIKQAAMSAGRTVGKSYPYDTLRVLERNHEVRHLGGKYYLKTAGGTGTVARSGTARTRTRKKGMGRAAGAAG